MTALRGWLWGSLIAVQFLTRIPIRFIPDEAYDEWGGRERSFLFYPLVGALVGGIGTAAWLLAHALRLPPLAVAVLTVLTTAIVTGALHEDGLADVSDALGTYTRDDALRVMRDSRIGTFGAVALWAILTLKAAALLSLPNASHALRALVCAHVLARWSSLPLMVTLPYARAQTGLAASLAASVTGQVLCGATVFALGLVGLCAGVRLGLWCIVLTCTVTLLSGLWFRARFGGITGDCLGATNQLVEAVVLLTLVRLG